ncbi:MAG: 5'/3'-nucleotidase SurE [Chitinivibrionales bacterium]|nr:5'/3'-nucleotidase SurE [Chitinivibrionales bacterium]MBD3355666.1 5'/3'-nucleotidase SurE [Chitinivibrionales bacterium]
MPPRSEISMSDKSSPKRSTILLTNDDGYRAPGIRALAAALVDSFNVIIVAPEEEQSGVSHSFTYRREIRCREILSDGLCKTMVVSGTPVDCVKFALSAVFSTLPVLVVSGMNVGENTGISGFYSGTVGAAREGAFWGIPSVAFSLSTEGSAHLDHWCATASDFLTTWEQSNLTPFKEKGKAVFLNVNFPRVNPAKARGAKVTRQSMAYFSDRYVPVGSIAGETLYELKGEKRDIEESDDFDSCAINNGWITITPLHFDATADAVIEMTEEMKSTLCAGKECMG